MLEQFTEYFRLIEMPRPFIERAEAVCNTFREFIGPPIDAVFVCDAYENPNSRRYTSLWLFVGNRLIECKNFVAKSEIDTTGPNPGIRHIEVSANNLSELRGAATIESRLIVKIHFSEGLAMAGIFEAHYNNCAKLAELLFERLMPLISR